jgi:N4-(beta-N-acetylglucosaminyl)-L-asparaginase
LQDDQGRPAFGLSFYAVNKRGEFGGATMWSGGRYAAFDGREAALHDSAYLFERSQ